MKPKSKAKNAGGQTTKEKILLVATRVFAEHGYRGTTTRMICREAKVNGALVNYYFNSKRNLYREVVVRLFAENTSQLKDGMSVTDEASWRETIETWVRKALAICAAEEPPLSYLARLMGREACVPSDMAQEFLTQLIGPLRERFTELLRMGMKRDDPVELSLWFSSIHAQWVVYAVIKPDWRRQFCPCGMPFAEWLEKVAQRICSEIFSQLSYQGRRK